MDFEQAWNNLILPKYATNKYADDYDLFGLKSNPFRITNRLNLTHIPCYTIDPENCEDADDGFSFHNGILYIHIADPTHYFSPDSKTFNAIIENGLTHYPSGAAVRHMMPLPIVKAASLMDTNGIKCAITIMVNIDPQSFLPIGEAKIEFTHVRCTSTTRYTYETAAVRRELFSHCLSVAKEMRKRRGGIGDKLAELSFEDPAVLEFKQMIAEFAIFANTTVAQYLQLKLGTGIFRLCDANNAQLQDLTASELMQQIVSQGLSAEYLTQQGAHDLVGVPSYCHFTSPLRRATDCICHFLVKTAHLNCNMPFAASDLQLMAQYLDKVSKKERKIQHDDKKFRTIQELASMTPFQLFFRVTGYTGLFLNVMLEKVNDKPIHISYVLRVGPNYTKWNSFLSKHPTHLITIRTVNIPGKYDQGTFPELDQYLIRELALP